MSSPLLSLVPRNRDAGPPTWSPYVAMIWMYAMRNLSLASIVVYVYDHLLTLGSEIEHFWFADWTISKILFLLTRYIVYADVSLIVWRLFDLSIPLDKNFHLWKLTMWLMIPGTIVAECIIILRTYAIYNQSKRVAGFLLTGLVISQTAVVVVTSQVFSTLKVVPCAGDIPGCIDMEGNGDLEAIFFGSVLVMEAVVVALTLKRGIEYGDWKYSASHTVMTLYRDGVLFFIGMAVLSLANLLNLVFNFYSATLLLPPLRILHSTFSAKILLHLREANKRDDARFREGQTITNPAFHISNISALVSPDEESMLYSPLSPVSDANLRLPFSERRLGDVSEGIEEIDQSREGKSDDSRSGAERGVENTVNGL